jgi:hypothetical protein
VPLRAAAAALMALTVRALPLRALRMVRMEPQRKPPARSPQEMQQPPSAPGRAVPTGALAVHPRTRRLGRQVLAAVPMSMLCQAAVPSCQLPACGGYRPILPPAPPSRMAAPSARSRAARALRPHRGCHPPLLGDHRTHARDSPPETRRPMLSAFWVRRSGACGAAAALRPGTACCFVPARGVLCRHARGRCSESARWSEVNCWLALGRGYDEAPRSKLAARGNLYKEKCKGLRKGHTESFCCGTRASCC